MQILRNVFKRKLRVLLTISGITIGVFALVVMGSMAEKINLLVSGGTKYYSDKVVVNSEGGGMFSIEPLEYSKLQEISDVPGVAEVSGQVTTLLETEMSVSFGMPAMIIGSDMRGWDLESFKITYSAGRELDPDEDGSCVVGADLVRKLNAEVGGTVAIRGEQFKVVGIMEQTLTAPDTSVYVTLADAQRLYTQDIPDYYKSLVPDFDPSNLATGFVVYPDEGVNPEGLAFEINSTVDGLTAHGPSYFQDEIASFTKYLNYILYGVALISLVVGGLSVINTMTMAVSERTREIGMRKAIGASDAQVVGQFLSEAGIIGFIGGITGLFLGWLVATLVNKALEASSVSLFLVTPRLALGSVAFAIFLGVVAGFLPSLHAARMKPVDALRYE